MAIHFYQIEIKEFIFVNDIDVLLNENFTRFSCLFGNLFMENLPDINECTSGEHNCHQNATCSNNNGSFSCSCNSGFSGNGTYCEGLFNW